MNIWHTIGKMPSTNVRIAVSLLLILATGIRVLVSWTAPPWEWLAFLGVLSGLDAAQFHGKRLTYQKDAKTETNGNGG